MLLYKRKQDISRTIEAHMKILDADNVFKL